MSGTVVSLEPNRLDAYVTIALSNVIRKAHRASLDPNVDQALIDTLINEEKQELWELILWGRLIP